VAVLSACGLRARSPRVRRDASAATLLQQLADRRAAITSLRARLRLRTGLQGVWTRQAVVVERPDHVRVDVLTPMGLALALGTRDALLWAYEPAERVRYEGRATPANLVRLLGAPIALTDVVDILLGMPPARTALRPPQLSVTDDGEYRLTLPLADGQQTIWFAGDTLAVVRAEERRGATTILRVAFTDHRDDFPRTVDVEAPARGAPVRLAYDDVVLNADVAAALFVPPPAERVLPLEAVRGPDAG
jgi:hypothetical protein